MPLLERASFWQSSSIDEFPWSWPASKRHDEMGYGASADGLTPPNNDGSAKQTQQLASRHARCSSIRLLPRSAKEGIYIVTWADLGLFST